MAIDTAATDENITLELELEHEVFPPNDTSQNPSHFQKPSNGISRRYPRLFTLSADYLEK